jgi:hypothetical protein
VGAVGLCLALCSVVAAGDFRVETDVLLEDEPRPVAETLTLFSGDVVYDFLLSEPAEITVFDIRRGRMILLDPAKQIQTTMTTEELGQFIAAIQTRAAQQHELFGMDFESRNDEASGELTLSGLNLTYQVTTQQADDIQQCKRYHEFADWYARLNAARPGNPPPFARLALNRELTTANRLPLEITRTLTLPGRLGKDRRVVRSRHAFTGKLSATDRKRIEDVATNIARFEKVSLVEYWKQISDSTEAKP